MININAFSPEYEIPFESYVVDRQEEVNNLAHSVLKKDAFIWVYGSAGVGKTTLLRLFSHRCKDFFKLHRTEIIFEYARDPERIKQRVLTAVQKPEHENTLLVIDEAENLKSSELSEILNLKANNNNLKLIFSSRAKPDSIEQLTSLNCYILELKTPDIFSVIRKRFELITDKNKRDKATEIISAYLSDAKPADKTPREILTEFQEFLNDVPKAMQYVDSASITKDEDTHGNLVEIKVDFIGILLALILFFISEYNSSQSEKNLKHEIEKTQQNIANIISLYASKEDSRYVVIRTSKLRFEPHAKSFALKDLNQNSVVSLVRKDGRWLQIKYVDYIENRDYYGWINEKNVKRISKKEMEGSGLEKGKSDQENNPKFSFQGPSSRF